METLERFYLNDPDFLLAARNAQPYPAAQQTAQITTTGHQNKVWQWVLFLITMGLITLGTRKLMATMAEKASREK